MTDLLNLESLEDELSAVVRAGSYKSNEEAVRHALTVLLAANADLRVRTAVELYRQGQVTLARAREIAGLEWASFKEELAARAVPLMVEADAAEVQAGADLIRSLRHTP